MAGKVEHAAVGERRDACPCAECVVHSDAQRALLEGDQIIAADVGVGGVECPDAGAGFDHAAAADRLIELHVVAIGVHSHVAEGRAAGGGDGEIGAWPQCAGQRVGAIRPAEVQDAGGGSEAGVAIDDKDGGVVGVSRQGHAAGVGIAPCEGKGRRAAEIESAGTGDVVGNRVGASGGTADGTVAERYFHRARQRAVASRQ